MVTAAWAPHSLLYLSTLEKEKRKELDSPQKVGLIEKLVGLFETSRHFTAYEYIKPGNESIVMLPP